MAKIRKYPTRINGKITKEYRAWKAMKARCYSLCNKTSHNKNYHLNNIAVCESWINSFDNFLDDMGYAPTEKHSLDRIDNSKGYCKKNCRWATNDIQAKNRGSFNIVITHNDKTMVLKDWAREMNIEYTTLRKRLLNGLTFEDAISKDPYNRQIWYNGKAQTIKKWAEELNISKEVLYDRKHKGWSIERMFTTKLNNKI